MDEYFQAVSIKDRNIFSAKRLAKRHKESVKLGSVLA